MRLARRSFLALSPLLLPALCHAEPDGDQSLAARRRFHRQMDQVEKGMAAADVVRLLGKPDQIGPRAELNYFPIVWSYGLHAATHAATLGIVEFDTSGKVGRCSGHAGYPLPPTDTLTESELRHMIGGLHQFHRATYGRIHMYSYNPLPLIRAVNFLLPFGKKKILTAIDEYMWLYKDLSSTPFLLSVLFEVPKEPGRIKDIPYVYTYPSGDLEKPPIPHSQFFFIEDIPLHYFEITSGGSIIYQPNYYITDYFKRKGKLRSRLLVPTDHPLEALENPTALPAYYSVNYDAINKSEPRSLDPHNLRSLRLQLLQLVQSVYLQKPVWNFNPDFYQEQMNKDWERMRREVAALNCHWDQERQEYVAGSPGAPGKD